MNGDNLQQEPQKDGWQFNPASSTAPPSQTTPVQSEFAPSLTDDQSFTDQPPSPEVSWSASEFIAHEKSLNWYIGLAAASIVIVAIVYLWTQDIFSVVVTSIAAVLFGIVAGRKPRTVAYHLDSDGISIGERLFRYSEFKSFGVLQDGAFSSIVFMPLKRFAAPLAIYYPPEEQEKIAFVLSGYLPFAPVPTDIVDRFLRAIHF